MVPGPRIKRCVGHDSDPASVSGAMHRTVRPAATSVSGIVPDRDAISREWVKVARTVEPNPAMREVYEPYHQIYTSLYWSTRDEMHRLAELGQ